MADKIIIDDVDVSECKYLYLNRQKLTYDHLLVEIPHYCDAENLQCENKDCYYKQLQRTLRENTNLKQNLDNYKNNPEMQKALTYYRTGEYDIQISILEKENKELKEQLKRNKDLVKIIKIGQDKVIELKKEIDKLKNEIIFKYNGTL